MLAGRPRGRIIAGGGFFKARFMFSLAGSRTVSEGAARGLAVVRRLREDNPRTQVATIAQVVRADDRTMAGELVNLLESEDEGVRFMAASALHKLTGKDLGFHFANTPAERACIIAEWRAWWEEEMQNAKQTANDKQQ